MAIWLMSFITRFHEDIISLALSMLTSALW
jgi:hypothetical protein